MKEQLEEIGVDTTFLLPINSGGMGRWMSLIDKNGYLISAITGAGHFSHGKVY